MHVWWCTDLCIVIEYKYIICALAVAYKNAKLPKVWIVRWVTDDDLPSNLLIKFIMAEHTVSQ